MKIKDAVDAYLLDHKARGSRPRTIEWHQEVLTPLLRPYWDEPVTVLTVFVMNQVLNLEVKPNTLVNYERSLRAFVNWLLAVELLEKNPFKGKRRARAVFEAKRTLSHLEIQRLFKAAQSAGRLRARSVALLAVFLDTGLRASEVARLRLCDVDWDAGVLRVDGKTGPGTAALGRQSLKLLRRYVTHHRRGNTQALFIRDNKPVSAMALSRWAKRLGERAGLAEPISCHTFRRTFATLCVAGGMDFYALQRAMRHSTPAMTQRYVNLDVSFVRRQIDKSGPLAAIDLS